ncbi:MAG: putative bifunctional diguanylate cyclase/phosphodiesterase [Lysobacteraceae bacterium]
MGHQRPADAEDQLVFATEGEDAAAADAQYWTILVVDDEPDVYTATCMALRDVEILGRRLRFLHAASSIDAFELLKSHPDVAVVMLDVVMESESAGLDLVVRIRDELKLAKPRIILRTGQPGYAPEMRAIREYDINDYRIKSELTRTRLFTVLTAALRSYRTLDAMEANRSDLQALLEAQTELLGANTMPAFALGVLERMGMLFRVPGEGLFCGGGRRAGDFDEPPRVVAATGRDADWSWRRIDQLGDTPEAHAVELAFATRRSVHAGGGLALYLPSRTGSDAVAWLATVDLGHRLEQELFELFVQNTAGAADGVRLVERLRDAAYVDGLTRLANRSALAETIDGALRVPPDGPMRLLLIDIDQFSELNETFGDRIGDALLHGVAARLEAGAGSAVRVARVANDTFAAFGPRDALVPADWARRLDPPFEVEGLQIGLSVSFGGVEFNRECASGGEAIKMAYSALKRAKQTGHRSVAFYSHEVATEIKERTRLLHGLRQAFDQQHLFLMYQPQVDAASGRVVGLEALMRWRADDGRRVPPDRFNPVAEPSGLIKDLGAWAMRSAIHRAAALRAAGHGLRMAVNVSMSQLLVPGFEQMVGDALDEGGLPAHALEIEITESVAMQSPDIVLPKLGALKAMGVGVAIDDFGTGYSSLSSLEKLAPDRLKIDRSFVVGLDAEGGGGSIAEMIIDLARTLGFKVVAEGVETLRQRRRLNALGCHELQGYLFSPPLMVDDLPGWLAHAALADSDVDAA